MPKTGNITGQPFDPEVIDQINARQTFLGTQFKEDKHLIYQNNKTAFLRMASSINIEDTENITAKEILGLRGLPESLQGSKLAQQCVLFGGVTSVNVESNSFSKPFGLSTPQDVFSGAYGWGGIGTRGYVPMPGIESVNISFFNRGALQKADVKVKVYSVEQLQIFDLLYFRIGYTMLIEWGHSLYIDNDQNLVNRTDFFTEPFDKFFQNQKQNTILSAIKEERKKSSYNYDAMLGKVTNFTWKFNPDGSYDIDLKLIGLGDVIEALKINTSLSDGKPTVSINTQLQNQNNQIQSQINTLNTKLSSGFSFFSAVPTNVAELKKLNTDWTKFLGLAKQTINKYKDTKGIPSILKSAEKIAQGEANNKVPIPLELSSEEASDFVVYLKKNYFDAKEKPLSTSNGEWEKLVAQAKKLANSNFSNASNQETQSLAPEVARDNQNKTSLNLQLYTWIDTLKKNKNTDPQNLCTIPFTTKSSNSSTTGKQTLGITQYYVRLGYFLSWIQSNLLLYDATKDKEPLFTFNIDPENNFCLRFPYQVSSDPFTCIIPCKNLDANGNGFEYFTGKNQLPNLSSYLVDGKDYLGKVMNIFVNIDFIAKTLDNGVDTNGKSSLLTFLNNLLNGINDALGNVNKLEAVYDTEVNEIKIIEGSRLEDLQENPSEKLGIFEVYGVKLGKKASFITNVDFQVQLPPQMAAMATISAQASGNIVGENATALSKLNAGLKDRVITTKLDASSVGLAQKGTKTDPEEFFKTNIVNFNTYLKTLYSNLTYQKDNADTLKSINRDIASYTLGYAAEKEQVPAPFFIPFNLSLDMDGLAGMRNYERFAISENILPYSYRSSNDNGGVIDFLIKGISHNIANNQWTTKIESLTVSSKRKGSAPINPNLSFIGNTNK